MIHDIKPKKIKSAHIIQNIHQIIDYTVQKTTQCGERMKGYRLILSTIWSLSAIIAFYKSIGCLISAYLFGALFIRHIHPHKTTSELLNLVKWYTEGYFPRWAPSLNSGHGIPFFEFHTRLYWVICSTIYPWRSLCIKCHGLENGSQTWVILVYKPVWTVCSSPWNCCGSIRCHIGLLIFMWGSRRSVGTALFYTLWAIRRMTYWGYYCIYYSVINTRNGLPIFVYIMMIRIKAIQSLI